MTQNTNKRLEKTQRFNKLDFLSSSGELNNSSKLRAYIPNVVMMTYCNGGRDAL